MQRHPASSSYLSLLYHLDNVHCSGDEDILSECEHNGVGVHNCRVRYEEAGVICNSMFGFSLVTYFTIVVTNNRPFRLAM